jgi:hypothetical protein
VESGKQGGIGVYTGTQSGTNTSNGHATYADFCLRADTPLVRRGTYTSTRTHTNPNDCTTVEQVIIRNDPDTNPGNTPPYNSCP